MKKEFKNNQNNYIFKLILAISLKNKFENKKCLQIFIIPRKIFFNFVNTYFFGLWPLKDFFKNLNSRKLNSHGTFQT